MPLFLRAIGFLSIVVIASSCEYRREKGAQAQLAGTWYDRVRKEVFVPSCVACHGSSGGVNLETYTAIKQNLAAVERAALIRKTMPRGGALSPAQFDLLAKWIKAGAPIDAPEGPGGGTEEPLKPLFSSIQKKILNVRCVACHSPGGQASGVPFQSLADLLDSPRELVLPGNVEESGLVIAITRTDEKRMPPPSSAGALSPLEIDTIKTWIQDGAKP